MMPFFPYLASHPVLRGLVLGSWALLPIFGTFGLLRGARRRGREKRGILWLFVLCQVPPWLLILVNVPLGLAFWAFCLYFCSYTYGARP